MRDLVYEMRGQDTGNVRAKKGAKAWAGVTELLRQRFNDAGGDIGYPKIGASLSTTQWRKSARSHRISGLATSSANWIASTTSKMTAS